MYLWHRQVFFVLQLEVNLAYCQAGAFYELGWPWMRRGHVLYLEKVVRGVLLQVGIQVSLNCLQQVAEAEAHKEWVVRFHLCHYCRQFNFHILLKNVGEY